MPGRHTESSPGGGRPGASRAAGKGPRRPWRGAAVLVAGIALSAVGVGIGPSHLAKEGLGAVGVLGSVSLAAGLVLVLAGTVGIARATGGWWRVLTVPAALVITLLCVYLLAVPLRAAVPARDGVHAAVPGGLAAEDVVVPTADGERLAGWYVPSREGAAVVLLPGAGSSRDSLVRHLRVLADGGYGVLALDPRGQGRSTGRAMDWGWYGERDVPDAVTYLAGRPDVDPARIAVVGMSMGGEQAVGAAGVDPRIRAVVAEGATGRCAEDLHWLSDVYGWRGSLTEVLEHGKTAIADLLSPPGPPPPLRVAAAAAGPRPILLIAAGGQPDEQHAAADIRTAGSNVQVWTVPGAGHTAGLRTDPDGWRARVLAFLSEATG